MEFLNDLSWNISLMKDGQRWKALAGDHLLVATNTQGELRAFLLGMTIGLAVLPDSILSEIKKLVAK